MRLAGQDTPQAPVEPPKNIRILRAKLLMEETLETVKALGVDICLVTSGGNDNDIRNIKSLIECENELNYRTGTYPFDMVEVADGCADVSVITYGTLVSCGITDKGLLELVDENNLSKFGEGHSIREDGKLVKPPNHQPPDIAKYLKGLGWNG